MVASSPPPTAVSRRPETLRPSAYVRLTLRLMQACSRICDFLLTRGASPAAPAICCILRSAGGRPMEALTTRCCIVGGGPAGMMLGFLLAPPGVDAGILATHGDFLRDFRGDTIHPSTLE